MRSLAHEAWLTEHHLREGKHPGWEYQPAIPLGGFDLFASVRNQARLAQAIIEPLVERYALDMMDGQDFPAVIAYQGQRGLVLMDGNQRLRAAQLSERLAFDCYVVDEPDRQKRTMLIRTANRLNGLGQTDDERLLQAKHYAREFPGVHIKIVAREFGFKHEFLERMLRVDIVNARSAAAGLDLSDLAPTLRDQLHAIQSDVVFVASAQLLKEAGLKGALAQEFLADVKKARSEAEVEQVIERWRNRRDIIEMIDARQKGRSRPANPQRTRLFLHLNGLVRVLEQARALADVQLNTPDEVDRLIDGMRTAEKHVRRLVNAAGNDPTAAAA